MRRHPKHRKAQLKAGCLGQEAPYGAGCAASPAPWKHRDSHSTSPFAWLGKLLQARQGLVGSTGCHIQLVTWQWGHTGLPEHVRRKDACRDTSTGTVHGSIHLNGALILLHFLKLPIVYEALVCEGSFENSTQLWQRMFRM